MDEYLGTVKLFGFNFAPRGWMTCQGQIISIAQNTALFSLLGTTYGGNGQTTFALPDLQGRSAIGQGNGRGLSNYVMGQVGGQENVTLTNNQLPAHTHQATCVSTLFAETGQGNSQNPQGRLLGSGQQIYCDENPANNRQMSSQSVQTTATVAVTGSSQPFNVQAPYLTLNYCICTQGIFPSRN